MASAVTSSGVSSVRASNQLIAQRFRRSTPRTPAVGCATRREAAAAVGLLPLLMAGSAAAKDVEAARKAAEERKKKLREAAEATAETGQDSQVFAASSYSVSEDHSPNIHSRQDEGARTQVNF